MKQPKYQIGQLVKANDEWHGLLIGTVVGAKWDTKISEWNAKCPAGAEEPSENEETWLYEVNAIGQKRIREVYEDDIDGYVEVKNDL